VSLQDRPHCEATGPPPPPPRLIRSAVDQAVFCVRRQDQLPPKALRDGGANLARGLQDEPAPVTRHHDPIDIPKTDTHASSWSWASDSCSVEDRRALRRVQGLGSQPIEARRKLFAFRRLYQRLRRRQRFLGGAQACHRGEGGVPGTDGWPLALSEA